MQSHFPSAYWNEGSVKIILNSPHIQIYARTRFFFASTCSKSFRFPSFHFRYFRGVFSTLLAYSTLCLYLSPACWYARNHHVEIQHISSVGFQLRENNTKDGSNWIRNESRAIPYCFSSFFFCSSLTSHFFVVFFSQYFPFGILWAHRFRNEHHFFFSIGFCVLYLFTLIVAISDVFITRMNQVAAIHIEKEMEIQTHLMEWHVSNIHMCLQ